MNTRSCKNQAALFLPQGRLLGPAESININTSNLKITLVAENPHSVLLTRVKITFVRRTILHCVRPVNGSSVTIYDPFTQVSDEKMRSLIEVILKNKNWSLREYRIFPIQFISQS